MTWITMTVWSLTQSQTSWSVEVKWALGSITMIKASAGGGIPAELFKILKDDAVEVLAFILPANLENTAIATEQEKVSFHSNLKKGNAKECSNYRMISLLTCQQDNAQNPSNWASVVREPRTSRCSSWIWNNGLVQIWERSTSRLYIVILLI